MNRTTLYIIVLCALYCTFGPEAVAQPSPSGLATSPPNPSPASYYYTSRPGELTMQVNIWGFVEKPGRYEVSSTTDLIQLISYAGGPLQDAKLNNVKVSRLERRNGKIATEEFTVNLERLDKINEEKLTLYPGDTIYIDHTSWITIRDVVSVVTTAAIITAAVAQVINVTSR